MATTKKAERSAAGYEFIHVAAPLPKRLDPEKPARRVVLFERNRAHPKGQAFLAQGDSGLVYPTARVRVLIASGELKEVDSAEEAEEAAVTVDVNSIHALDGLSDATLAVLDGANIRTIKGPGGLVERRLSGDLEKVKGVAKKRVEEIDHALLAAAIVSEDDLK